MSASPFEWRESHGVPVEVSNPPAAVPIRRLRFDPAPVRRLIEAVEKWPADGAGRRLCTLDDATVLRSGLRALASVLAQPRQDCERLGLWHHHLNESASLATRKGWRALSAADHANLLALLREIIATYNPCPRGEST